MKSFNPLNGRGPEPGISAAMRSPRSPRIARTSASHRALSNGISQTHGSRKIRIARANERPASTELPSSAKTGDCKRSGDVNAQKSANLNRIRGAFIGVGRSPVRRKVSRCASYPYEFAQAPRLCGQRECRMRLISILLAAAVVAVPIAPPPAATVPHTQTFYGTQRSDPYHWMESGGPELASFIKAQSDYTQALLSTNPGRPRVVRAVRDALERSAQATTTSAVYRIGSKVFFLQSLPGSSAPSLQVRVDGRSPAGHHRCEDASERSRHLVVRAISARHQDRIRGDVLKRRRRYSRLRCRRIARSRAGGRSFRHSGRNVAR